MCNQRCHGCAFTPGSEANREPNNHLRALICLLGPAPFYCHENIDWRQPSRSNVTLEEARAFVQTTTICRGWQESVRELAATGYYKDNPLVTKFIGVAALQQLDMFLSKDVRKDIKQEAARTLRRLMQMLGKKRRKYR